MEHFLFTKCYDIIDLLLWGAMTFAIGADVGAALSIISNHKPNRKKKGRRKNERL